MALLNNGAANGLMNREGGAASRRASIAAGRPLDHMVRPRDPNAGGPEAGLAIPHSIQFAGMIGGAWRTFMSDRWDEALRRGREEANCMRRDCFIQALIQERALASASLKWHVEVDNDKDPAEKAVKDGLTAICRAIPHLQRLIYCLVDETIWVGRGGTQLAFEFRDMKLPAIQTASFATGLGPAGTAQNVGGKGPTEKRRALCVKVHQPVSGDSINHEFDGTPLLLVNTSHGDLPGAEAVMTTKGRAVALRGSWRQRFLLHQHIPVPAEFFDFERAEAIHGVGLRSVIYWWNNLKMEWVSNTADWVERTGLGVRIWRYAGGNPASKAAVEKAAREQDDKVNILMPMFSEKGIEGVDFIDTASAGADLLLKLVEYADGFIERYVIGQSMSSGADNESGLGGSGRAALAQDTKGRIIRFDANNASESITEDLLKVILRWTYPDFADMPVRFVLETDEPDPQKFMTAAKTFQDMGGDVREDDCRGKIGLSEVSTGDKILQPKQPGGGMPMPGGAPGMPGAPAPGTDPSQPGPAGEQPGAAPAQPAAPEPASTTPIDDEEGRPTLYQRGQRTRRRRKGGFWHVVPDLELRL